MKIFCLEYKSSVNQAKTQHEKSLSNYGVPCLNLGTETASKPTISPNPPNALTNSEDSQSEIALELERQLADFEAHKRSYENKITELQLQVDYLRRQKHGQLVDVESSASFSELTSLYSPYSTPVVSPGNSAVTSPTPTPRSSVLVESNIITSVASPPPPPPALPVIPAPPLVAESHVRPSKPVVHPKIEMKPLFWNRIVASSGETISFSFLCCPPLIFVSQLSSCACHCHICSLICYIF